MKTLFPYPTLFGDVSLTVTEVAIDDQVINDRVDVDGRSVALHGVEKKQWEQVRLSVVVDAPAQEIVELDDVVCAVVLNCHYSNTRRSFTLTPDDTTSGRWMGEVLLDRQYWYGQAELRCGVIATVDAVEHRIVGWADNWALFFDDLPNRPVNGALKITWVDFTNPGEDKVYLTALSDNYMYLSIDPLEPQLFLNSGFDGLQALLADRKRRHLDKALHDQTRASIADKTWASLFNAAMESVAAGDNGEPEWPETEWQRTVLQALLGRMYPDRTADDALDEAWTAMRTPESGGVVQQLLGPATAVQAKAPRLLRDGIRALSTELNMTTDDED
jgi:hypothetical protein